MFFYFYVEMWKFVENANDCEVLVFGNVENVENAIRKPLPV
jgi:hypothetical protein